MPQVELSIEIGAPPAIVFALIADQPERLPEWWPSFELQQRVTPPPTAVGSVARYVYNMMGVRIKGEQQVLQMDSQRHLVIKTLSGLDSMFDFSFAPTEAGGTRLTVLVAYALPGSMLGQRLNRHTIEQKYEHDLEQGLQNLQALAETEAST